MPDQQDNSPKQIRVRAATRQKVEAIRGAKRWTVAETIDAIADAYMAANSIALPEQTTARPAAAA